MDLTVEPCHEPLIDTCRNPLNRDDGMHLPHEFLNLALRDRTFKISPNLHTLRNVLFANYIFHFPLMKVEGSAETLGLLETLNIFYTILTRVTFLFLNMFPSPGYRTIFKTFLAILKS